MPILNNEMCASTNVTKSLGHVIDDKLSFEDHVERVCSEAKRSWDKDSRILGVIGSWQFRLWFSYTSRLSSRSLYKHQQYGSRNKEIFC